MSSKFSNLLSQARNRPNDETESEVEQGSEETNGKVEPVVITPQMTPQSKPKSVKSNGSARRPRALEQSSAVAATESLRGRPRNGKRSDPDFIQITAYIKKDTHRDVKIALIQEGKNQEGKEREISELVQELLAKWLQRSK